MLTSNDFVLFSPERKVVVGDAVHVVVVPVTFCGNARIRFCRCTVVAVKNELVAMRL